MTLDGGTAQEFDLSVTAFSVSKSSIVTGEAITLNATVTNDSSATVSSPVAELKYYRSTNATIDATDTEVGTADSIGALAAAATSAQTATDSPSVAGTYYYGACIVATGDSDTSNNCSTGARLTVTSSSGGALAASATSDETASVTVPSSAGTYYYGACVAASGDSDTGNN